MKILENQNCEILNDDCLNILKNMKNESVDLVITDPPYKVISGGKPHKKGQPSGMLSKNDGKIFKHNDISPEVWIPEVFRVLKNDSQCYIMVNTINMEKYLTICRKTGFKLHNILGWLKNNCTPSRWYMKNCEYVLFLRKGKAKTINDVGSKTIHQFNNIIGDKVHPTEKPIDLMELYVTNSSNKGDIVLDPFMGSGATGIATLKNDRKFIGIEIDREYFDISKKRINEYINKKKE